MKEPIQEPSKEYIPQSYNHITLRNRLPVWVRMLPRVRIPEPSSAFELVDPRGLDRVLQDADPASVAKIKEDIAFLDYELLRLFRQRDYQAKKAQNEQRMGQLMFIILATLATMIGSFQALAMSGNIALVPLFAFLETVIALLTTFWVTTARTGSGEVWYRDRARSEYLRREYFRYLLRASPYDHGEPKELRRKLSLRAAEINRGVFPKSAEKES